jgi:hypothetical protein
MNSGGSKLALGPFENDSNECRSLILVERFIQPSRLMPKLIDDAILLLDKTSGSNHT